MVEHQASSLCPTARCRAHAPLILYLDFQASYATYGWQAHNGKLAARALYEEAGGRGGRPGRGVHALVGYVRSVRHRFDKVHESSYSSGSGEAWDSN